MNKSTLLIIILAILPTMAFASHQETLKLASQLDRASSALAQDSRSVRGFNSVTHNAQRLSSKARQLTDSIFKERTSAYVRTRFTDVSRYYQRLEAAYLRAGNGYRDHFINEEFNRVATLYDELRYHFYGDGYNQSFRSGGSYYPAYPRSYYGQSRRYTLPPVFVQPPRNYTRGDQRHTRPFPNRNRRDGYDHRSPVVERQNRQGNRRDNQVIANGGRRNNPGITGARGNRDNNLPGNSRNSKRQNPGDIARDGNRTRSNRTNNLPSNARQNHLGSNRRPR